MNARLLPLLAMTILFMFAWNGDQNAMQAAIARRDAVQSVLLAETYGTQTLSIHEARHVAASTQLQPTQISVKTTQAVAVPLPPGISPGHYQAVSQAGVTIRVHVPPTEPAVSEAAIRDLYISDTTGGDRWYLVRIDTDSIH